MKSDTSPLVFPLPPPGMLANCMMECVAVNDGNLTVKNVLQIRLPIVTVMTLHQNDVVPGCTE